MNKIHILDCTLRDGGYCNQWKFGFNNIKKIVKGLGDANIDIIECGFLTNKTAYDPDSTKYTNIEELRDIIPISKENRLYVAMVNYGEYDTDQLPACDGTSIDGIRVAFHKKDLNESLAFCHRIKEKGYLVFMQPMVSLSYSDEEFLALIQKTNQLNPYAFYIVDSFGMMKEKDLTRLFYMVEHNLKKEIWIGFHSHNNMQLAYSNAQRLVVIQSIRNLIIDSSIYGMGRGAGNLNTELFIAYLNENAAKQYYIKPLLNIIDEILEAFYQRNYWGYSLPNYIAAAHNAHPNYAGYLDNKKTLTIEDINEIFDMFEDEKKVSYDRSYIEALYIRYMTSRIVVKEHRSGLKNILSGKKVLLIAPGKSSVDAQDRIGIFSRENDVITVSVNFDYAGCDSDFIFVSNHRRFRELNSEKRKKCIVTSNIPAEGVYYQTDYQDLLCAEESVIDNAGLMAIKFLISQNVNTIYLAGFDGYSHNEEDNYGNREMALITPDAVLDAMNEGMSNVLKEYFKKADIRFFTPPKFITI